MKQTIIFLLLLPLIIVSCTEKPNQDLSHELLNSVLWVQHAAEYKALTSQAYNVAKLSLDAALQDKNWTAASEQTKDYQNLPAAVILDVDETVLDNSPYETHLIQTGTAYNRESWNAWCAEKRAKAIPGAVDFCNYAIEKGVKVFYVTNRRDTLLDVTRANLEAAGFPLDKNIKTVLTRSTTSDKNERRTAIAESFRILLLIGDNGGDFFSGFTHGKQAYRDSIATVYESNWGTKWIVLPNPMYGDWEGALFNYDYGLSKEDKLKIKYEKLIK